MSDMFNMPNMEDDDQFNMEDDDQSNMEDDDQSNMESDDKSNLESDDKSNLESDDTPNMVDDDMSSNLTDDGPTRIRADTHHPFELFLINEAEGEKKITEKPFAGTSNTSDFIILKEDHTIGNLLAEHLKQANHVLMAGYKVGHPNVPEVLIRVQTDGTVTPREVFIDTCKQLIASYAQLGREFTREYELRRMVQAGEQENGANGGNGASGAGNAGNGSNGGNGKA